MNLPRHYATLRSQAAHYETLHDTTLTIKSTMNNPAFIRSVDTETLIQFLRARKNDELISYEDMNGALRREGDMRPQELATALKILLDDQVVFVAIKGKGIRQATPAEVLELSKAHVCKTRRATRRVLRKIATVKPEEVDAKEYGAACARVALIAAAADKSIQKDVDAGKIQIAPLAPLTRQQLAQIYS